MSTTKLKQIIFFLTFAAVLVSSFSCNKKEEDEDMEIAVTPALVAVKNFYLQANDSVLSKLDSVTFSIDLNTGVIFNADSLPKGTKVSRLVPVITFANSMSKAELVFTKDEKEQVTVDYLKNASDSIDFSEPVTLNVTAQDGVNSFSYQIKVNVHTQVPDTLFWDKLERSPLPSRYSSPVAQKTVKKEGTAFTLIEEYNGEYTLASCPDLNEGNWTKEELSINFNPSVESFTATSEAFWILDQSGLLWTSTDGVMWTSTNQNWISILGSYGDSILGIRNEGSTYLHTQYPLASNYSESVVEEGFPIYNSSEMGVVETPWYPQPFAILACGTTENGSLSSAVWGYDGSSWAILNETSLPALEMPMMTRYVVYRQTPYVFTQRRLDIWLLFGGWNEENEMNRKVYMSYDNGVTWIPAPKLMQLPKNFPVLRGADIIVGDYILTADISEAWTPEMESRNDSFTRADYTINGYDISWICPYLYVFGGYGDDQSLSTDIWRGVIERLRFTPLI